MADDLAAEITLRLRAQMSGPVDDIKKLFEGLNKTIRSLDRTIQQLSEQLDALKVPSEPVEKMRELAAETNAVAEAADKATKGLRDMGRAPVGRTRVRGDAAAAATFEGPKNADDSMDWLGGAIAGAIGLSAITQLGDYQKTLRQIAITEKLSGPKADAEVARLSGMFDMLALKDRQSSLGLADAYFRMITTHMPASVVRAIMPDIGMMATAHAVSPYDLADAAFAINDSFKIGPTGMLPALEMLATAAKQAHFSIENFGQYLKEIGGVSETMGLTGRGNLDMVAAGLETVIKNSTQPNQAAADYRDFLVYLNSPQLQMAGARMGFKHRMEATQYLFSKYHIKPIGLWQMEDSAKAHGKNEVTAILDYLHRVTAPMTAGDRAKYLRTLFGNQQSAMTVQSILLHWKDYQGMMKMLGTVTAKTGATDFQTALKGANTDVAKFDEEMRQLTRDIGNGLLPLLKGVNLALTPFMNTLHDLNTVTIPVLNAKLGDLTLGASAAYATLKTFGAVGARVMGKKGGAGSESVLEEIGTRVEAGIKDAPAGAEAGWPGMIAAIVAGAIGNGLEDSLSKAIYNAGGALGDAIGRALGMHVVDVHVTNSDSVLSGRHHTHNPAHLPRKTPPSGPLLNRP